MILRRSLLAAVAAVPFPAVAERTLKPLSEVLNATDPPADLDDAPFYDADNAVHRISEFRGRGMVVNMFENANWISLPICAVT